MMGVIPKYKTKPYKFGITQYGVVKINSQTGKVCVFLQYVYLYNYANVYCYSHSNILVTYFQVQLGH